MTEKENYKNKILTELFKSGKIHKNVELILFKNKIHQDTKIADDLVQETFYHLSKFNTDTLIEMYEDNPKRLLGLGVTIAIRKGVLKNPLYPDYPKQSLCKFILFTSSLSKFNFSISDYNNEDNEILIIPNDESSKAENELWKYVHKNLNDEENKLIEMLLVKKNKSGTIKKQVKMDRENLYLKVKNIIRNYKIETNE